MDKFSTFSAKFDDIHYYRAMRVISNDLFSSVIAETLNRTASEVTADERRTVQRELVIRTAFTLNSFVSKRTGKWKTLGIAMGKNVDRMYSRAGALSPYLRYQEDDYTRHGVSGRPVPVPGDDVRKDNDNKGRVLRKFGLTKTERGALKPGNWPKNPDYFFGIPRGKNRAKGLWWRNKKGSKLVMLYSATKDAVKIKGIHFHAKALQRYGNNRFMRDQFKQIVEEKLAKIGAKIGRKLGGKR